MLIFVVEAEVNTHVNENKTLKDENSQFLYGDTRTEKVELLRTQVTNLTTELAFARTKIGDHEKDRECLADTDHETFTIFHADLISELKQLSALAEVGALVRNCIMELAKPPQQGDREKILHGARAASSGAAYTDALLYVEKRVDNPRTDFHTYVNMYGFSPTAVLLSSSRKITNIINARVWVRWLERQQDPGYDTTHFFSLVAVVNFEHGDIARFDEVLSSPKGEAIFQNIMNVFEGLRNAYDQDHDY
jgi:hypothetical protein